MLNEASIVEFLATGVVILISIAIAAGIVFLLALAGILWTLFARKDDKLHTFAAGDDDDDDDSAHHRPSSLLEHINAATRTTILGGAVGAGAFGAYNAEKEEEHSAASASGGPEVQADPFGPDASNYMRAETPSDAVGGLLGEEMSRPAHARYSFDGTGEGELPISSGAEVEVLDDRDPAYVYFHLYETRTCADNAMQMVVCARCADRPRGRCPCGIFVLSYIELFLSPDPSLCRCCFLFAIFIHDPIPPSPIEVCVFNFLIPAAR